MFEFFTQRFRDMDRLTKLFNEAERLANLGGQAEPGAEHMVMAALTLPEDESGRLSLAQVGKTPEQYWQAVEQQYMDALDALGIKAPPLNELELLSSAPNKKKGFYRATESMHDLLDIVTTNKEFTCKNPFITAEIILGATRPEYGVVARAFQRLGVDKEALAKVARVEIEKHSKK